MVVVAGEKESFINAKIFFYVLNYLISLIQFLFFKSFFLFISITINLDSYNCLGTWALNKLGPLVLRKLAKLRETLKRNLCIQEVL